jgi:hypothetical protein
MGGFGRCCCDCCLEPEEMPYTTATLKLPNATTCEGEEPSEEDPVAEFVRESCCYKARFEFPCEPAQGDTCVLYAKQQGEFSFKAVLYQSQTSLMPAGTYDEDSEFGCDCIPVQSRTVSVQSAARLFFRQSHKLKAISISVGKVRVICSGDTQSECKYYIASSWEYEITEGISRVQLSSTTTTTCTADYEPNNCSVANSWIDQAGVDSDSCSAHDEEDLAFINATSTVTFSRMKLYDTLPDAGDVTVDSGDTLPFSCCDGKTGCTVSNYNCGISIESNCLPPLQAWPQEPGGLGFFRLIPCTLQTTGGLPVGNATPEPVYLNEAGEWVCYEVIPNGYETPSQYQVDVYVEGVPCYIKSEFDCTSQGVGFDRIGRYRGLDENGQPLYTWSTMCGTAYVDACDIQPNVSCRKLFPDCFGGGDPPLPGLCQSDDCCSELLPNGAVSTTQCPLLGPWCGYKFENFTCSNSTRSNFTVGNTCVSLPSVTVGLA